jgi:hypothetical protein
MIHPNHVAGITSTEIYITGKTKRETPMRKCDIESDIAYYIRRFGDLTHWNSERTCGM